MATKKPNIVMIYVDNHPGAVMGCAGNAEAYTPNLDRLLQDATLFTEAYCPNAMCSPCRACHHNTEFTHGLMSILKMIGPITGMPLKNLIH